MKLSILIPYIPEHEQSLRTNILELFNEMDHPEVEVLLKGGKAHNQGGESTGSKRNALIQEARGKYVVFVDADDIISVDYVDEILRGIETGKDIICFDVTYMGKNKVKQVKYSSRYKNDGENKDYFERLPNHLMAVRRGLAIKAGFPNVSYGEDFQYALRLKPLIKSEHQINKTLYTYVDRGSSLKYKK